MGQQQPTPSVREALKNMGFSDVDVDRVDQAGIREVSVALDYIQNRSNTSPDQTNFPFSQDHFNSLEPLVPTAQYPSSMSSFEAPGTLSPAHRVNTTSLSNARNSLDGIDVSRVPSDIIPSALVDQNTQRFGSNHRSNLNSASPSSTGVEFSSSKPPSQHPQQLATPQTMDQQDDDLKRALQLSRDDQHEREMKQALRMSKQEDERATTAFNNDHNDPDILRAIEESLKENQHNGISNAEAGGTDKLVSWQSHAYHNSQNMVRQNLDDPVGLRNIGNTCYLNSLLQVYFYLPEFRRAVLSFRAPPEFDQEFSNQNENINVRDGAARSVPAATTEMVAETTANNAEHRTSNAREDCAERKSESTSGYVANSNESSADLNNRRLHDTTMKDDTAVQSIPATTVTIDPRSTATPTPSPSPIPTPIPAPPAPGETSVSDKSDNRSERIGESERTSKRHAVEFVIELQRLFAAMALGTESCVDPTGVARSMRNADGHLIKIGDQQDASEFNHLFLDIVERGLQGDVDDQSASADKKYQGVNLSEDLQTTGGDTTGATTATAIPANVSTNVKAAKTQIENSNDAGTPDNNDLETDSKQNKLGDANPTTSRNVVKDLFTVKFRQEVRQCDENERVNMTDAESEATTDVMMSEGETNCIIVDATTSKERDLYSGLDDYAIARIEYNVMASTDSANAVKDEHASSPQRRVSGQDATAAAVAGIRDNEQTAVTTNVNSSTNIATIDMKDLDGDGDDEMQDVKHPYHGGTNEVSTAKPSTWGLKSVWLTKLPPVLVVYLQRVRYNVEKSAAEKVHDKYDFSPEIALDRYLEQNREASGRARERVSGIRKERRRLTSLIRRYRSFPADSLAVGVTGESAFSADGDVTMLPVLSSPSPSSHSVHDGTTSPKAGSVDWSEQDGEIFKAGGRIQKRLIEALNPGSQMFAVNGISKENVDVALHTIERVLENDRRQCERLKDALSGLESETHVYRGLDKEKYQLHAVLVHDGAPSGGHYWTFIRDWRARDGQKRDETDQQNSGNSVLQQRTHKRESGEDLTWIKFSDSVVTRVSEKDMLLWSSGGHGHASAYCLIYRAVSTGQDVDSEHTNDNIADECRCLLPPSRLEEINRAKANVAIDVDANTSVMNTGEIAQHGADAEKVTTVTVVEDDDKPSAERDVYPGVELRNQAW